jgi:hypothetical protein
MIGSEVGEDEWLGLYAIVDSASEGASFGCL